MTAHNTITDGLAARRAPRAVPPAHAGALLAGFVPTRAPAPATPGLGQEVSIDVAGNLRLGQSVYEALGRPAAVELLWDNRTRRVALRRGSPATFTVRPDRCIGVIGLLREKRYPVGAGVRRYPVTLVGGAAVFGPLPEAE